MALGSNVSDTRDSALVWTSLAQRLVPPATDPDGELTVAVNGGAPTVLPDGNYSLLAGNGAGSVDWLWVGGLGIMPSLTYGNASGLTPLAVSVGTNQASWSTIGPYSGDVSGRLLKIILDHGRGVQGHSFAYSLLPNVTASAMPGMFNSSAGVSCVTNNAQIQGAAQPAIGVAGAVFWPGPNNSALSYECDDPSFPGGALAISSNVPAIVLTRVNVTSLSVVVSQSLELGARVVVSVSRKATGPGCSASSNGEGTDVSIQTSTDPNYLGAPVMVVCEIV